MSRHEFLANAINGLASKNLKAVTVRMEDFPLLDSLLKDREDGTEFHVSDNWGRYMLKKIHKQNLKTFSFGV